MPPCATKPCHSSLPLGKQRPLSGQSPNVIVRSRSNLFLLAARSFSLQRCWFLPDAQADSALWVLHWAMSIVERSTGLMWANKCVTDWGSWSAAYKGEANKHGIDKKGFDIFVKSFSSFSSRLWVCCDKSAWNTSGQILMRQYMKPFPQYLYSLNAVQNLFCNSDIFTAVTKKIL